MKKNVGVWIDQRRAVIVQLHEGGDEVHSITCGVESSVARSNGGEHNHSGPLFPALVTEYYDSILTLLQGMDDVLILGPGEAKVELSVRMNGDTLGEHIAGIENEGPMTDDQLAARVRKHFMPLSA
ncbi:MAG: hypothetical protein WCW40_12355 [Bacteroidota bacterium]